MPKRLGESLTTSGMAVEVADLRQLRQESFDGYLAMAQAQPDNDEAQAALLGIMNQAFEEGEVDFLMQNAMLLAATACTDPHMEDTANKAGEMLSKATASDENIRNGGQAGRGRTIGSGREKRPAKATRRRSANSISQLVFKRMMEQGKPSGSSGFGLALVWPPSPKS